MALIRCPECNKEISSYSEVCIGCGYPIRGSSETKSAINGNTSKSELRKLRDAIKPVEFKAPHPRMRVCIKCARLFDHTSNVLGVQTCRCKVDGRPAPGVEIDFPVSRMAHNPDSYTHIFKKHIYPRRIGDKTCEEYKNNMIRNVNSNKGDIQAKREAQEVLRRAEAEDAYFREPPPLLPKCPHCSSTSLTKLSNVKSFAKILTFGLAGAGDVGKTYKCNNCGSRF